MQPEDFAGLTPEAAMKKAATFAGVGPEVIDAQWATESGRGQSLRGPATQWGVAEGHFQFLPTTRETWEGRLKRKLNPDKFEDALTLYAHQMRENTQATRGDVGEAVRMYHGGPNRSQWGSKTADYARKVLGGAAPEGRDIAPADAMQISDAQALTLTSAPRAPTGDSKLTAREDALRNVILANAPRHKALAAFSAPSTAYEAALPPFTTAVVPRDPYALARAQIKEAQVVQEIAVSLEPSFLESVGAAIMNAPTAQMIEAATKRPDLTPEPGRAAQYRENYAQIERDPATKEPYPEWARDIMRTYGRINAAGEQYGHQLVQQRRERERALAAGGAVQNFMAGLLAEGADPANIVTGVGVGKAAWLMGTGSIRAMQGGRAVGAVAATAAENAAGNVAADLLVNAIGDAPRSAADMVMNAAAGVAFTVPFSPFIAKAAHQNAAMRELDTTRDAALQQDAALLNTARERLGPDASPEAVQAEALRIHEEQLRQAVQTAEGPVGPGERFTTVADEDPLAQAVPRAAAEGATTVARDSGARATTFYTQEELSENLVWFEANTPATREAVGDPRGGAWASKLPAGVHSSESMSKATSPAMHANLNEYTNLVRDLHGQFYQDASIVLKYMPDINGANARFTPIGKDRFVIEVSNHTTPESVIHEFGHGLAAMRLHDMPAKIRDDVVEAVRGLQQDYMDAGRLRHHGVSARMAWTMKTRHLEWASKWTDQRLGTADEDLSAFGAMKKTDAKLARSYWADADELMADQFVKYVQARLVDGNIKMSTSIRDKLRRTLANLLDLFRWAKRENLLDAQQAFVEFFDKALSAPTRAALPSTKAKKPRAANEEATLAPGPVDDLERITQDNGLDLIPDGGERKLIAGLFKQAERVLAANPVSPSRLKTINSKLFGGIEATATRILSSQNPVLRAFGILALESPTGATTRHKTAAITKNMKERLYMGGMVRKYETAYDQWRAEAGGNALKDAVGSGQFRQQFDRLVAVEVENRLRNLQDDAVHPAVKEAADQLGAGYDRMRVDQQAAGVVGSARLGSTSRGYMPHRLRRDVFTQMTNDDARAATEVLSRQFQDIEGFDAAFSDKLAKQYLDHARIAALGGNEVPLNIHDTAAADMVRDALKALDMGPEDIEKILSKYSRGGANYTKKRLHLDLNEPYMTSDGKQRTLLDLFETDQLVLFRSYARRASGEVALAQFGIMGTQGLKVIRRAAEFGAEGQRATPRELESFDQVAAEFLGRPFGSATKLADNLALLTSMTRLGGMAFTQMGEMANAVVHLGVARAFDSVTSLPRMVREVGALKRGDAVSNPILRDVEKFAGAIGMDSYQMALPRVDAADTVPAYGQETLTAFDRMLRLGGDLNAKLSFWKALHAAQQRGMAEQIVHKAAGYIRSAVVDADGKVVSADPVLTDMGFTPALVQRLRAQMAAVSRFEGDTLVDLRLSEMADVEAAEAFSAAVMRGAGQIIQGTFIGESSKLAHSSVGRLLAQFRTFSITSVEKQWNRTSHNVGTGAALGYLLGSMAWALPLYYARTALAAVGRPDVDEFLEQRLAPGAVVRAVLNYTALSGYATDILDISAAIVGHSEALGGRAGGTSSFFGNTVAPSAGLIEDTWKATQRHDVGALMRLMPGASLPFMVPLLNATRD